MPLSWNEIRLRASHFSEQWKDKAKTAIEKSDAYDFMTDFFDVFGVSRRKVAILESRINIGIEKDLFGESISEKKGYMDLFYKGKLIIEMKSPGKDKEKAYLQAREYAENLEDKYLPYCILISDFLSFDFYYLDENKNPETFLLDDLSEKVELFGFLAGYKDVEYKSVNPVDIEAAEHMGELHDALKDNNYTGHELEMFLVRLLFCLFADDSGIFEEKKSFLKYIDEKTSIDGSDLALHLGKLFEILNTDTPDRQGNEKDTFKNFRFVNGGLFKERLKTAAFNSNMRKILLKCCTLDWSKIMPEIFGAMFQSIKDKEARRELGEHYTSEKNILKVIRPLFLDELWKEFKNIITLSKTLKIQKLLEFHTKLQKLKFLDPACGCGNFLVVSYRELRLLEIEVLSEYLQNQKVLDIELMIRVNVDQFYGIEIEEFPAQIAKTALWLMDHLMNNLASEKFGKYIARIPLTATPNIVIDNALTINWEDVVPKNELSYILGNPPFLGKKYQTQEQKKDMHVVLSKIPSGKSLDFVTCWYYLATKYIKDTSIQVGFVSTNSITQGEQVAILWNYLFSHYSIHINFAHKTFKWSNEAKGKAAVYCVIIGFSQIENKKKFIFDYPNIKGDPVVLNANRINGYLVDSSDTWIISRTYPISDVPEMIAGNKPVDYNNLKIEKEDYKDFIKNDPLSKKYIKKLIGAEEFINKKERYCLWLVDCPPEDLKKMPEALKRIEACKKARLESIDEGARKLADTPTLFRETMNPKSYLVIPCVSSEKRNYIPIGFFDNNTIPVMGVLIIPEAKIYHFGILTSKMHMVWTRYVCGRLKSDYRYSKDIVYNNFPWCNPTVNQKEVIEKTAQEVLNIRDKFSNASLADLYDPLTMPPELLKAHHKLDIAVEKAYNKMFNNDKDRIEHLFYLYQKETEGLLVENPNKKRK